MVQLLKIKAQMSSILAKGCMLMFVFVLSDLTWLPLLRGGRKSWYIILLSCAIELWCWQKSYRAELTICIHKSWFMIEDVHWIFLNNHTWHDYLSWWMEEVMAYYFMICRYIIYSISSNIITVLLHNQVSSLFIMHSYWMEYYYILCWCYPFTW